MSLPRSQTRHPSTVIVRLTNISWKGYMRGLILTFLLAFIAKRLADLPPLAIIGTLVLAILLGMGWRAVMDVPDGAEVGITFATKKLLRIGIILMGLRLDLHELATSGFRVMTIDLLVISFALFTIYMIGRHMKLPEQLTMLTAVGTAICGASAILAVAPLIRAKQDLTALAVSFISITGTIGALVFSFLYPMLPYDPVVYGVWTGATLHELGHVIAAGAAGGAVSVDMAIFVKLGRVALLIPVAIVIHFLYQRKHRVTASERQAGSRWSHLPIPWFIFGFLAMSAINTIEWLPTSVTLRLLDLSSLLLTMAMAGIGLGVSFQAFRKNGIRGFLACMAGSMALAAFGILLVEWLY